MKLITREILKNMKSGTKLIWQGITQEDSFISVDWENEKVQIQEGDKLFTNEFSVDVVVNLFRIKE